MVTTIRNNVGSNLYRPFALGQRLFSFHFLLDHGGCTLDGGGMEKNARGEKTGRYLTLKDTGQGRFDGRGTPSSRRPHTDVPHVIKEMAEEQSQPYRHTSSSTPKRVPITFRM